MVKTVAMLQTLCNLLTIIFNGCKTSMVQKRDLPLLEILNLQNECKLAAVKKQVNSHGSENKFVVALNINHSRQINAIGHGKNVVVLQTLLFQFFVRLKLHKNFCHAPKLALVQNFNLPCLRC